MSNLRIKGNEYCCGITELGNFNYSDPEGGKKMPHYHKGTSGGWVPQENAEKTTKEEIYSALNYQSGAIMCTTGAGQEYVEPILTEMGFTMVSEFVNPGHARTPVRIWILKPGELKKPAKAEKKAKKEEKADV